MSTIEVQKKGAKLFGGLKRKEVAKEKLCQAAIEYAEAVRLFPEQGKDHQPADRRD